MIFKWVQRGFTGLSCCLLVFLFLVPGQYLKVCEDEIAALCDEAADALLVEDIKAAGDLCRQLAEVFERRSGYLKWFLDNAAVGEVEHGIELAQKQITSGDNAGALVTLLGVKHNMAYLAGLEGFEWNTIV